MAKTKKATAKKTVVKKVVVKKPTAKKTAAKKAVAKKTPAKKAADKKPVLKKAAGKKAAPKKTLAKKAAVKKPVAKKSTVKKAVVKKAAPNKAAAKKALAKKPALKRSTAKKSTVKKASAKMSVIKAAPKNESLRRAYGDMLVAEGKKNKDIVVLEADLGKSTMSFLFQENFPDRYFEMGIAEQNMTSAAAGLALAGKIPFTGTFAVFAAGRAYDQIRCSIAIPKANVKLIGSSCGLSDYGDGKTHQSVEDANIIRTIPHMVVLNPADAEEVRKIIPAILKYKGPVYLRINRGDLPVYTAPGGTFTIGKIYPMNEGKDIAIFATGVMVSKAMEAAEKLKKDKISAQVLNVSTLKPLSKAEVLKYAKGKKAILVAEEAVRTGGLGETIASMLIGEAKIKFDIIAIEDEFGTSALNYEDLLVHYGLSANHVYKKVLSLFRSK